MWGVYTSYSSTKGIKKVADPIIENVLDIPGVRSEFQKIFLRSLYVSQFAGLRYLIKLVKETSKNN